MTVSSNVGVYSGRFGATYGTVGYHIVAACGSTGSVNIVFLNGSAIGMTGSGNIGMYSGRFGATYSTVGYGIISACYGASGFYVILGNG